MFNAARRITTVAAVLAFLSCSFIISPAAADQTVTVPVVHLEGRGHGHGVGMSQWGAFTMAQDGASAEQIIAAFYPGTELAHHGGEVVVGIDRRNHVRLRFPGGGEVRSARGGEQQAGFPVAVAPGGTVDIVREAAGFRVVGGSVAPLEASAPTRYSSSNDCVLLLCSPENPPTAEPPPAEPPEEDHSDGGSPPDSTPPPAVGEREADAPPAPAASPGEPPPSAPGDPVSATPVWAVPTGGAVVQSLDRGRSYRGLLEVSGAPGSTRVRNHVDIEDYLKGMAEVPGSWPAAAVQAQTIAARTYALRAMATAGELCDTESCQVYVGTSHESAGQAAAVEATRNVVVMYGGGLAATFYSASAGGHSANIAEGFGTASDIPYLQARPYTTVRPDEWAVDIALRDVARRLGYPGTISAVRIDEVGPSSRPLRMTLEGDAGPVGVDPQDFRRKLGLRSTLFSVKTTETAQAPPPPPDVVDPGVVGADASATDEAIYRPARTTVDRSTGEMAAMPVPDAGDLPRGPALVAFLLLVATWSAHSLRAMTSVSFPRIRMGPWRIRHR